MDEDAIVTAASLISEEETKEVLDAVVLGASASQLAELMCGWSIEKRADGMELVAEYFRSVAEFDPDAEMGKAVVRLNHLFQQANCAGDHALCLSVQKEINRLLSLYA